MCIFLGFITLFLRFMMAYFYMTCVLMFGRLYDNTYGFQIDKVPPHQSGLI